MSAYFSSLRTHFLDEPKTASNGARVRRSPRLPPVPPITRRRPHTDKGRKAICLGQLRHSHVLGRRNRLNCEGHSSEIPHIAQSAP